MNETKKLVITIVAVAILVLGLLGWTYVQMATIGQEPFKGEDSIAYKIDTTNVAIGEAQKKIDQIEPKKEEYEKLLVVQDDANQLLPKKRDPAELLNYITQKAKEAKVDAQDVTPKKAKAKGSSGFSGRGASSSGDKFEEWLYEMKVKGTYDEIATFINKMEEFEIREEGEEPRKRFFAVKEIKLKAQDSGLVEGDAKHTAELVMVTYRYKGDEVGAAAGRPGAKAGGRR
ncbi:MAG: hypothetical protein JXR97_13205 [Planctomycetes bacterium]|nr:hypothetical protein [Planctomycetota bacterium]